MSVAFSNTIAFSQDKRINYDLLITPRVSKEIVEATNKAYWAVVCSKEYIIMCGIVGVCLGILDFLLFFK